MPSAHTPPSNKLTPNSWDNFYMDFDQTDGKMVISGSFTDIDNTGISYLAKWDGNKWIPYNIYKLAPRTHQQWTPTMVDHYIR